MLIETTNIVVDSSNKAEVLGDQIESMPKEASEAAKDTKSDKIGPLPKGFMHSCRLSAARPEGCAE